MKVANMNISEGSIPRRNEGMLMRNFGSCITREKYYLYLSISCYFTFVNIILDVLLIKIENAVLKTPSRKNRNYRKLLRNPIVLCTLGYIYHQQNCVEFRSRRTFLLKKPDTSFPITLSVLFNI